MSRSLGAHAAIALLGLTIAGCADRTAILVEVTSADLTIPADLDELEFDIVGLDSDTMVIDQRFPVGTDWPHSLSIRPGAKDDEQVRITVTARRSSAPGVVVAQAMRTESFSPGESRRVLIQLGRQVVDGDGGIDAGRDGGPDGAVPEGGVDGGTDGGPGVDGGCWMMDCDDGDDCTDDACSELLGCVHTTRDADGDGFGDQACPEVGGVPATDCDDESPAVHPGATELCNGADDDCDLLTDETFACAVGETQTCTTTCGSTGLRDCHPTSCTWSACVPPTESCNGVDDDCDGVVDEGCGGCTACTGATTISAPGGRYTVTLGPHAQTGSCGGAGSEAYFTFTLTETSDVFLTTHHTGSIDTVLYVRDCACAGTQRACNDDADGLSTSTLQLTGLAAGTYNVVVDTKSSMSGSVTLDAYIDSPGMASDRCSRPSFVPASLSALTGNTCGYAADYDMTITTGCPSGRGGDAQDRVYYFYLPTAQTVELNGCNAGTTYDTTLYLRSVCTVSGGANQPACADDNCGGPPSCTGRYRSFIDQPLNAGLYYLFVDGWGDASTACPCGDFNLAHSRY